LFLGLKGCCFENTEERRTRKRTKNDNERWRGEERKEKGSE
jgi:hypothetical protein